MKLNAVITWGGWLTAVLAFTASLGIFTLLGFGYHSTRQWQKSTEMLVAQQTEENADLLVTALMRDMSGVQSRVLVNRDWAETSTTLPDTSAQVASAFTRYPYPESFFTWRGDSSEIVFFNRTDRFPRWITPLPKNQRYPVVPVRNPPGSEALRSEIDAYGRARYRYVALERTLGGESYQVVARLTYADPMQERLDSVMGFTVNLGWMVRSYFPDVFYQALPIGERGPTLEIGVVDEQGRLVWGSAKGSPATIRAFPLLFVNPSFGKLALETASVRTWRVRTAQSENSPLVLAAYGANEALITSGIAAFVMCLGLVLTLKAVREGIALATMRSDFVSSVTHDLKMPLANLRLIANTFARRTLDAEKVRHYADFLMHEVKRLTRLVDNLLAYARVTDVADVYSFEPIPLSRLVDDALQRSRQTLSEQSFDVQIDVPDALPLVKADRTAMVLALDNLIDNAVRYSKDTRALSLMARCDADGVALEISDRGVGIPPSELRAVQRKFVRGRLAPQGGTGLGLAIVSRIILDHGGRFDLTSQPGIGTTARIRLTLAKE